MPEAPELAVVREVLERRIVGLTISSARVLHPFVLRSLAAEDFPSDIAGRWVVAVTRYGKTLTLALSHDRYLAVVPMLTGKLQLAGPKERVTKQTLLVISLGSDLELRCLDDRQMGMVYYARREQLASIPRLEETGPDVLDQPLDREAFARKLRAFHGEIKGILTRGQLVAGIGNAYADEVLFAAGISPFRRRRELAGEEVSRLHQAVYSVPREAVVVLRERMGEQVHLKPRDWLQVHNKGGQPCTRCGSRISQITARQQNTSYCLKCQPGLLVAARARPK